MANRLVDVIAVGEKHAQHADHDRIGCVPRGGFSQQGNNFTQTAFIAKQFA
jgi:hypothetical protein